MKVIYIFLIVIGFFVMNKLSEIQSNFQVLEDYEQSKISLSRK
jgi:hypothetical protein